MRSLERITEWIAGDGRWAGGVLRLGALAIGSVGLTLVDGHAKGRSTSESIFLGLAAVLVLVVPFAIWRFMELRRQVRRRRDKAIQPIDLS